MKFKIIYIIMFLFLLIKPLLSSGVFIGQFGVNYVRQLAKDDYEALDEVGGNITLFGKLTNNLAWQVFVLNTYYNVYYTSGDTYKHQTFFYGAGFKAFIADGLFVDLYIGGTYDKYEQTESSSSTTTTTVATRESGSDGVLQEGLYGGGIGYILPFPYLTFIKPFFAFNYYHLFDSDFDIISFSGGLVFVFW